MTTSGRTTRARRKRRIILKGINIFVFFLLLPVALGAGAGGFMAFTKTVPSIAELRQEITPPSTRIFDNGDNLIGELKLMKGKHVPYKSMPPDLVNAVISIEDSSFWKHSGIDYFAIMRAAIKDVIKRHLKEGGSTITQQLAKIAFLTPEKTFKRKLREFVLAHRIEKNLTKEEILELYLNRTYYGQGAYGVEMAALVYFGKSAKELTLPEAALIAGLLKAPSAYSPLNNFAKAKDRQMIILNRMEEEGYISRRQRTEAESAEIVLQKGGTDNDNFNYFIEYVKNRLLEKYGEEEVYKAGLKVYTTIDGRLQRAAEKALKQGLRDLDKRRGWRGPIDHIDLDKDQGKARYKTLPPKVNEVVTGTVLSVDRNVAVIETAGLKGKLRVEDALWAQNAYDPNSEEPKEIKGFSLAKILKRGDVIWVMAKSIEDNEALFSLEQQPEVQGAIVAIEPNSGFIRAVMGGYDFSLSEFNRALYANRQAGSAFKPVIYAMALKNGFTPASIIVDEEISFEDEEEPEKIWMPQNYDEEYKGPTSLRKALALSRNVITVKLVDEIGIERAIRFAREVGVKSEMPRDLTLSLGSLSITPLDLTNIYCTFASGGMKMEPIAIKYVTDRRGRIIETNEPQGQRVVDPQTSFLITSMMKEVVEHGTGWRAKALHRPVAGKTGTTNDYRDAWFLGYTTDMVAGVWVGFDDMKPLGPEETGSRAAAPIWVSFMKDAVAGSEPKDFPIPKGIVSKLIDPETGLLANRWTVNPAIEFFVEGTEPKEQTASIWDVQEQPRDILFLPQ